MLHVDAQGIEALTRHDLAVNPWEIESQPIVTYCPARHICLILFGRTVAPLVVVMEERSPPGADDGIQKSAGPVILPIHKRSGEIHMAFATGGDAVVWLPYCAAATASR